MLEEHEVKEIEQSTALSLSKAQAFTIVTREHYELGAAELRLIAGLKKQIDATFDPIIKAAFAAHKIAVGEKKKHEAPLLEAETFLRRKMVGYDQEQERLRREEEARLQKIADEKAAADRKVAEDAALAEAQALASAGQQEEAEAVI